MTTTNRAIYRFALRTLDTATFARFAAAEPDLNPLEAELLARYLDAIPLVEMAEAAGVDAAEIERLQKINEAAGDSVEEIELASRCAQILVTEWRNSAVNRLLRCREELIEAAPRETAGGAFVKVPAGLFGELLQHLAQLDEEVDSLLDNGPQM